MSEEVIKASQELDKLIMDFVTHPSQINATLIEDKRQELYRLIEKEKAPK